MWLEYIRTFSTPFIALCGLLASVIALWVSSRTASKADLARVEGKITTAAEKIEKQTGRVDHLEDLFHQAPTRQELQADISKLSAGQASLESAMEGVVKQLDTANGYLHTLVEKGLK